MVFDAACDAGFSHVQEHRSFPSIVMWVVFNEGWGQYDTQQVVQLARSLDASRLIDPASGWVDAEVGALPSETCNMRRWLTPHWSIFALSTCLSNPAHALVSGCLYLSM